SSFKKIEKTSNIFNKISMFATKDLNEYEIDTYFSSNRRHIEEINNSFFSFFYSDSLYVVLKAKELNVERPHGHVLRTGKDIFPSDESMSSTTYAYGIFNSQLTIGNTSFNKLLSVSRNHLNVLKSSGQRIFIKEDDGYKLLGVPSAFEIGINHCKWIYKGNNSTIIIKVWTCMHEPACFLEIEVEGTEKKEFIISNNIVLGNNELDSSGLVNIDNKKKKVELTPAHDEQIAKKYPDARFFIVSKDSDKIEIINGDSLLYDDEIDRNNPYVVIKTKPVDKFSLTITGNILSAKNAKMLADKYEKQIYSFNDMLSSSRQFWMSLCKNAKIRLDDKEDGVDKLNDILFWYLHNAMVHYTVPHGLEQYSGAAWGVRDVCQGPVEFLISTQNYSYVKDILKLVFAHQYRQSSNWPQWFMFDRFCEYQQHESHGDIIIWPLKALCDYIEATNDFSILDEEVCYTDEKDFSFTSDKDSIFSHTKRLISNIENNSIINTSLLCYGDGDWDDTLQPADASMKKQMVSGWTVELVYQTFNRYKRVCKNANQLGMSEKMEQFCEKIKNDFNKYVIKDGVVSGFVYFHNINNIDNMLHPGGSKTGIKYRLLPMTRGMISEIFTKQQVKDHYKIIKNKLYFPDGVRLMDTPAKYNGGMQKYFKRAETSANFGREIGLQYVHAHIRYIEAMAKIGDADEVYKALLMINPITIDKVVPSAMTRQSNSYFSSSDANFTDRYIAKKDFLKIKKSKVKIKGGWRIYSSGPGIYINQLISNFLGIRVLFDDIVIDPVIPKKLNGLFFNFEFKDKKVEYRYNIMTNVFSPGHVVINGKKVDNTKYEDNPYRRGGLLINKDIFYELLNKEFNVVEIFV
ncbi:MAG: cellobiose phosphorylase, partial [Spirochaetes bacterium]|nr:cellobiose phosphorylase [Spirochaetota bacterium]